MTEQYLTQLLTFLQLLMLPYPLHAYAACLTLPGSYLLLLTSYLLILPYLLIFLYFLSSYPYLPSYLLTFLSSYLLIFLPSYLLTFSLSIFHLPSSINHQPSPIFSPSHELPMQNPHPFRFAACLDVSRGRTYYFLLLSLILPYLLTFLPSYLLIFLPSYLLTFHYPSSIFHLPSSINHQPPSHLLIFKVSAKNCPIS